MSECDHKFIDGRCDWCGDTELDAARAELDALKEKCGRLEEKAKTTHCLYCGEAFPLDTVTGEQLTDHIYSCKKHPLCRQVARADAAEAKLGKVRELSRYSVIVRPYPAVQSLELKDDGEWIKAVDVNAILDEKAGPS